MKQADLTVGRVAERCGVKVSTLHFYEEKGLIHSSRNLGNQRRYTKDVLRRVSLIKAAQKMGVSLEEIKSALATLPENRTPTNEDWVTLASHWKQGLNERIRYLENLRDLLTGCIGCGCLSMNNCPIYNENDKLSTQGSGPVLLDNK
ncbi:MAG: redox-sensitive transcriptional activator SoxR [Marinomonas sp.]